MPNILLAVTGSVAAIKTYELVEKFSEFSNVKAVATKSGKYFIDNIKATAKPKPIFDLYLDEIEWPEKYTLGDDIQHIELRKWANCLVIAPLDANSLAKISNGICDNLLTSVVRAWDWSKPIFICPAMNVHMWENEPTSQQINIMTKRGTILIDPKHAKLACNDIGVGAMANVDDIVNAVKDKLEWHFPIKNCYGIPINHHPGAFGFNRKKNRHTGVDLYTNDKEPVYAVEDGTVVHIDYFTGPKLGHDWWEETWGVMIEGASGVINYGEITPKNYEYSTNPIRVGNKIHRGEYVGCVKRVLFEDKLRKDIPGHSCSMLHLELYRHGTRNFADWHVPQKNENLLDPTHNLILAKNAPKNILTWENAENRTVG